MVPALDQGKVGPHITMPLPFLPIQIAWCYNTIAIIQVERVIRLKSSDEKVQGFYYKKVNFNSYKEVPASGVHPMCASSWEQHWRGDETLKWVIIYVAWLCLT